MIEIVQPMDLQLMKSFFLFVNTRSGDGEGAKVIHLAQQETQIQLKLQQKITLHFVDMLDFPNKENNYALLSKELRNSQKQVYVVICGGDGTISWVINQLAEHKVSISDIIFGILPIGTGNDMCRSLGWPSSSFKITAHNLANQINEWLTSTVINYDLWEVTLHTYDNGTIYDIKNKVEVAREEKNFTKLFTNYVGLGLDARVVYTMEKHRTSSSCINKILYGLVGCINCFRPLKELYNKIAEFTDRNFNEKEQSQTDSQEMTQTSYKQFKRESSLLGNSKIKLKKGYRGIVCLNCTSYMCGLMNVWATTAVATKTTSYHWKPQSSSDGLLEFVAYKNELNLALERLTNSGAKVAQGTGPFQIILARPKDIETTYLQIDGQSVRVQNLRSIDICRSQVNQQGAIKVLVRP